MSSAFHARTLFSALATIITGVATAQQVRDSGSLDPIKVTADPYSRTMTEGTGSYTSDAVTVGSKLPLSMRETPQSVSVITRQRIEEQNLQTLDMALLQTPGISVQNQTVSDSGFFARGFQVQTGQIDGLPWTLGTNNYAYGSPDLAVFDHVEVLRGSAGLFTGAGNPGAVINLVRKRPLSQARLQTTLNAGSWNQGRVEIDASSPLFGSALRGRMVAAHEDREYFYDVADSQKTLLYGVLDYDLTESTRVTVGGLFQQFDTLPMHGVALPRLVGGASVDLPTSTFLGAAWNRNNIETRQLFGDIEHRFNQDWNLKVAATDHSSETDYKLAFLLGAIDPVTGTGAFQRGNYVDGREDQTGAEAVLSGAFTAFGRRHEVIIGANL
jgi:outer membrane receptor for ferric coprogen and ferric-rhodotorulic acid